MRIHPAALASVFLLALPYECSAKKKTIGFAGVRPHIGCQVCKEAVKAIHGRVKDLRAEKGKGGKIREERLIEIMEHSCHPKREEGRWMRYFDIQSKKGKKGDKLELVDMGFTGKLKKKHTSIADACMTFVGGDSELSTMLFKDRKRQKIIDKICVDGGDSGDRGPCHKRFKIPSLTPKLAKAIAAEEFIEADSKELDAEKMVADMGGKGGMPEEAFQMYSRDNIDEMAIDELVKEGMDEDEAAEMFAKMKAEGMFDMGAGAGSAGDMGESPPEAQEEAGGGEPEPEPEGEL